MKIAILGAGSAGILTTGCILKDFKNRGIVCEVTHIYDTNKPILGVGESTTSEVTFAIGQAFDFIFATEAKELNSTTKYGTQYIDWREKDIIFPFQSGYHAIHFDARDFAKMGLERLPKYIFNVATRPTTHRHYRRLNFFRNGFCNFIGNTLHFNCNTSSILNF